MRSVAIKSRYVCKRRHAASISTAGMLSKNHNAMDHTLLSSLQKQAALLRSGSVVCHYTLVPVLVIRWLLMLMVVWLVMAIVRGV